MSAALATNRTDAIEAALVQGDLSKLSAAERVTYYRSVCDSLGLNPLTKPFEYITLNGKLTLYARKDATDQLRKVHGISISEPTIRFEDDWIIVSVTARTADGRSDADVGVVNRKDMRGDFGNALMKAVTKSKRRVTLSICGMGMLDETEVETIPDARHHHEPAALPAPATPPTPTEDDHRRWINDAASTPALVEVWSKVPPAMRPRLVADKDRRKAELASPVTPARDPADPDADPFAGHTDELPGKGVRP